MEDEKGTLKTPKVVQWAKWGTILLVFLGTLYAVGVASITTAVRWAAAPIVEQAEARGIRRDSLIISEVRNLSTQVEAISLALQFREGSSGRERILELVPRIKPVPVKMSSNMKPEEKK